MRLLITGGSGYLGRRLCELAEVRHEVFAGYARRPEKVSAGTPVHIDLLQPESAVETVRRLRPRALIHTVAVNPGGPEDQMFPVNLEGTRRLIEGTLDLEIRWVHVSTDVVHDGRRAPYTDSARPTPLGTYAQSKAAAEKAVLEALPEAAVVRTSLIYGLHEMDHGTAGFAARLRRGEPLRLFSDVLRQPVWVETLARALLELAEGDHRGFLNVAGSQVLSREDFGRRMLCYWCVEGTSIESARARDVSSRIPRDLRLRLGLARRVLTVELPGVDEVLSAAGPRPYS